MPGQDFYKLWVEASEKVSFHSFADSGSKDKGKGSSLVAKRCDGA